MKPVNSKSLLAFVFDQMEKLDNREIDVDTAKAQASLISQANNIINNEIKRAKIKMELEQHNEEYNSNLQLREVESKNFD